jgi:hypothetical protein
MTTDSRSDDPIRPGPGPDDATAAWAAPVGPSPGVDPFDRPLQQPIAPVPVPAAPVSRRGGSGMFVNAILAIALVVAVGGVAFAVGRATAPAATATGRTGFGANGQGFPGGPNASGAPGGFNGGFGAGGISIQGTVTAVSADSITLQIAGGQSLTIPLNASTTYATRTPATAAAVTSGSTVIVQLEGGRGAFGNGNGGQGGGPNASGAPGRTLGPASNVTVVPTGS